MRLKEFSLTIEYCKGKLNNAPNALSWAIIPASLALYSPSLASDEKFAPFPLTNEDVWEAPGSDPEVHKLYEALLRDDLSSGEEDSGFVILEDKVYRKTTHPDWVTYTKCMCQSYFALLSCRPTTIL